MVVHRAPTRYSRVRDVTILDDEEDHIELIQHPSSVNEDPFSQEVNEDVIDQTRVDRKQPSVTDSYASQDEGFHAPSGFIGQKLQNRNRLPFLSGWRVGALVSLIGATLVFILNLSVTIYVWTGPYKKLDGAIGTLYEGSCAKTRHLNVWIHLLVNVLSTLLLGASNYCMQVLSAPNREELVRAHGRRIWLHIGVPSLRNLRHIGRPRAVLWLILFLSSMPLHLLFNSVVFTNLQANDYTVVPTTDEWLGGGKYDFSGFLDSGANDTDATVPDWDDWRINATDADGNFINNRDFTTRYNRLDTAKCFEQYNDQYISNAGNLYIIQDSPTVWRNLDIWWPRFHFNNSYTWMKEPTKLPKTEEEARSIANVSIPFHSRPGFYPSNGWRCPSHTVKTCDVDNTYEVPKDLSDWQPFEVSIKYCLAEEVQERCRLQFSFLIAVLVVVSNFIKAVCMALTLLVYRRHLPLVTLGDTVAHFLDHPDPETKGRCLFSRHLMEAQWAWEQTNSAKKDELGVAPERFDPHRQRWHSAPSHYRWFATYILYTAAIIFGIVCIARSLSGLPSDPVKLWQIGFGNIAGNNLLSVGTALGGGILRANAPQAALSYLYLAFNALYTNMFVAQEWSTYMTDRKPLRVTSPVGQQRSTYWLNVPFRYAIPMTVLSGLFHWLASQSIFLVQITITNSKTRAEYDKISTCGFSPLAIILCTILGSVIALGGFIIGRFRYAAGMPVAGSCSAAISAACHPLLEDTDASVLPVQWGAVSHGDRSGEGAAAVGHCTFSSLSVEQPIRGRFYA